MPLSKGAFQSSHLLDSASSLEVSDEECEVSLHEVWLHVVSLHGCEVSLPVRQEGTLNFASLSYSSVPDTSLSFLKGSFLRFAPSSLSFLKGSFKRCAFKRCAPSDSVSDDEDSQYHTSDPRIWYGPFPFMDFRMYSESGVSICCKVKFVSSPSSQIQAC